MQTFVHAFAHSLTHSYIYTADIRSYIFCSHSHAQTFVHAFAQLFAQTFTRSADISTYSCRHLYVSDIHPPICTDTDPCRHSRIRFPQSYTDLCRHLLMHLHSYSLRHSLTAQTFVCIRADNLYASDIQNPPINTDIRSYTNPRRHSLIH